MPRSRATSAVVWPSEDRYKSIARALKSGANLLGLLTISSSLGPIRPRSRASRKAGEPHSAGTAGCSARTTPTRSATNYAVDLRGSGEHQQARELDDDTLSRYRRVLGEDHPDTLRSATNLAEDQRQLGE
jgi:Tetratricopeptide repeat